MGMIKMTRSITTSVMALDRYQTVKSKQVPGIHGSHAFDSGLHWANEESENATGHRAVKTPTALMALENAAKTKKVRK